MPRQKIIDNLRSIYQDAQWSGSESRQRLEGLLNNIRDTARFALEDLGLKFDESGKEL